MDDIEKIIEEKNTGENFNRDCLPDLNTSDSSGIRLLMPDDPDFPYLLNQLEGILPSYQMPRRLFVEGTMPPCDMQSVARNDRSTEMKYLCVVGARKHSSYGREACERIIEGLAGYNICIVSGLALGIDSIAHEAALKAGLPTIAFPGSGLRRDVLYPARHARLAERILEAGRQKHQSNYDNGCTVRGGALVSEFDMDFHATDWSFPQRNRLMAGISHGTLVIEAKLGSGTLITSRMAGEFNRDVFAVPGSIFSKLSDGPNMLINKSIALATLSSDDILDEWGITSEKRLAAKKEREEKLREKLINESTTEERCVLDILIEPMEKDRLIRESIPLLRKSVSEINALLSMMEISGSIVEEGGLFRAY